MLEAFWIPLLPPFFLGLLLSWAVECLLLPRPAAPWRRPWAANFTHLGVWLIAFALELALFRRPYFAVANVLAIQLVIILVSRAKYQALQEPFVYPDFEYFTDAIKHPRLYLPFLGWWGALAAAGGYGLALWSGLVFEAPITAGGTAWHRVLIDLPSTIRPGVPLMRFYPVVLGIGAAGLLLAWWAGRRLVVNFDAAADVRQLGLVPALWAYGSAERAPISRMQQQAPFSSVPFPPLGAELPDLISIQSESFFDVRRAYSVVKPDVLSEFDKLRAGALAHGELEVAARGANTVRTEFAFLSGMNPDDLGVHRFNPYRRLGRHGVPTLANYLKAIGYRTICVHPYYGNFYRRDRVLPALGFDEFIDLRAFERAERVGAYVGDSALADFVIDLLQRNGDKRPVFVHVITMENHGPLHWEKIDREKEADVIVGKLPKHCEDLVAYLHHLRNADLMFKKLSSFFRSAKQPIGLCLFGDHVPIMPKVYRHLGAVSGRSDYVIWHNRKGEENEARTLNVSTLAALFLSKCGLMESGEWRVNSRICPGGGTNLCTGNNLDL
ncbi:LTA synthase family protein [Bordetella hinzii]|nr:LTA synthase family protein [Bordetella hinzii]